jgi:hypothetical protein
MGLLILDLIRRYTIFHGYIRTISDKISGNELLSTWLGREDKRELYILSYGTQTPPCKAQASFIWTYIYVCRKFYKLILLYYQWETQQNVYPQPNHIRSIFGLYSLPIDSDSVFVSAHYPLQFQIRKYGNKYGFTTIHPYPLLFHPYFLWASSASILLECGFWFHESLSSVQQRLCIIWMRVFIPWISSRYQCFHFCLKYGGNRPIWMLYVKYEDKSTISNTRGPVFVSSTLCRENFHAYGMKYCTDGRIGCLQLLGFDLVRPNAAWVEVAPVHAGSSQGTRIWVS